MVGGEEKKRRREEAVVEAGYRILTAAPRHLVSRELSAEMRSQITTICDVIEAEVGLHTEADGW